MINNKIKRTLAAALAVILCIPGMTAFADPSEEVSYSEKKVTTHILNNEDTEEFNCLFRSDLPEMPYLPAEEYMDAIYTVDIKVDKVSDHVYQFSNKNGSMTVDTEKETVSFVDYEMFTFNDIAVTESQLSDYLVEEPTVYADPDKVNHTTEFDLSKYGFDITEKDGKVYFPMSVLTSVLMTTFKSAAYIGDELYIYNSGEDDEFIDTAKIYEDTVRSENMADQNYRELCFIMDNFYGAPERVEFAKLMKEKGFDAALGEYSEQSKMARQLLQQQNNTDFVMGLNVLDGILNDGGHTVNSIGIVQTLINNPDLKLSQDCLSRFMDENDPLAPYIFDIFTSDYSTFINAYANSRMGVYHELEMPKMWTNKQLAEDGSEVDVPYAALYIYDDTAIFVFNSFEDDVAAAFKEALDCAQENGIKNVLVDLTCNFGGIDSLLRYMMSLMADDGDLPSTITLTGNKISRPTTCDRNLDGKYDNKDKEVKYDMNFGILISNKSFSCGHILPLTAKNDGIMLVGTETSGGGSCAVQFCNLSNGYPLRFSSVMKFTDKDGKDTDLGVTPDYVIAKGLTNEDLEGVDPTDVSTLPTVPELYDVEKIDGLFDEFYGKNEPELTLGDVNGDGNIDVEDAVMVIGHVNGQKALTDEEGKRANVDKNNKVDIEDAVAIIAHVNGLKAIE